MTQRKLRDQAIAVRTADKQSHNNLSQSLGPIHYREIKELKSYDGRARRHSKRKLSNLAASIKEFGFITPVLTSRDGEIIVGEARVAAARDIGLKVSPQSQSSILLQCKSERIVCWTTESPRTLPGI